MGLDLKIIPIDTDEDDSFLYFGHTLLYCERERDFFSQIQRLEKEKIKYPFYNFYALRKDGERGYGKSEADCYGDPLMTVMIWDLIGCTPEYPTNKGIIDYLKHMDMNGRAVLFWC